MDDDLAACVTPRDRLLDDDLRVSEILRGDAAEHVRRHHAQGRPADDLVAERAGAVAEHDAIVALFDDEEVPLYPALQVDEHVGDLLAAQALDVQRGCVRGVDLVPDALPDDTDESRCLVQTDDLLQRAGEMPQEGAQEDVALERDVERRDFRAIGHGCGHRGSVRLWVSLPEGESSMTPERTWLTRLSLRSLLAGLRIGDRPRGAGVLSSAAP